MMAALGVVVGYLLGTRHGRERLVELADSIEEIANSQEFKDFIALGGTVVASLLRAAVDKTESPEGIAARRKLADMIRKRIDAGIERLEQ